MTITVTRTYCFVVVGVKVVISNMFSFFFSVFFLHSHPLVKLRVDSVFIAI